MFDITDKIVHQQSLVTIDKILSHQRYTGCMYVGELCVESSVGWRNEPSAIFYQPNPDVSLGHSHYFALSIFNGSLVIHDGTSALSMEIALIEDEGKFYYSGYRHDYVSSPSGYFIDGGRDYTRSSGNIEFARIRDGKWFKLESGDL